MIKYNLLDHIIVEMSNVCIFRYLFSAILILVADIDFIYLLKIDFKFYYLKEASPHSLTFKLLF